MTAAKIRKPAAGKGAIIIIILLMIANGLQAYLDYGSETDIVVGRLGRATEALDYELAVNLHTVDELLIEIANRVDPASWPDPQMLSWLSGRLGASSAIGNALLIGLDGRSIGRGITAKGETGEILDVSNREYFRYHIEHPQDHENHIGDPFVSRVDGRFTLPMSRGIFDRQGKLLALIRVTINPEDLVGKFAELFSGKKISNAILYKKGTYLVGAANLDPDFAKLAGDHRLLEEAAASDRADITRIVSDTDGQSRLVAYRTMPRYSLVIFAGLRSGEAYVAWRRAQYRNAVLLILLSAVIYGAAALSDRREYQRRLLAEKSIALDQQAARAQALLAEAIGNFADAAALFDERDSLVMSNDAFVRLYGYPTGTSLVGRNFEEILRFSYQHHAVVADGSEFEEIVADRMARHQAVAGASVNRGIDGTWHQTREFRTRDGGILVICADITELKRREEELRSLQRRYELILESAGDGIIGMDLHGNIIFANRTACSILVCDGGYLLGRKVSQLFVDGGDADMTQSPTDALFVRPDQSVADVQYQAAPIVEEGITTGAVLVFRDVALRRQYEAELADHRRELERLVADRTAELQRENEIRARTEAALRASRERLRSITDSMFHCVLVFNYAGHIAFANVAARKMLGVEEAEVEGLPIDDLLQLVKDGELQPYELSPLQEAAAGGVVVHGDDALIRVVAGAGEIPITYVCTPLSEEGQSRSVVMSFRDITDVKNAQWEALQASRLASVGQLASGIAHEINTPIQYIGNNLNFIGDAVQQLLKAMATGSAVSPPSSATLIDEQMAFLAEELPVAITESLDGVGQIARIVLSMKEFSHPGSASKSLTDINHALETTLTVTTNVWKQSATIVREFDPDLPAIPCHAGEMNQVFLNLIVNAAHAIESSGKELPGTITLTTTHDDRHVEIRIADNGTGIPAAIREKIFDPFFTTKEVGKGTGQGLAITRDVVIAKHGGRIDVGGKEGEGAIFIISLPIDDSSASMGASDAA